ncbi:hypothetical protein PC129_g18544 [Phytophthora cactorum]|uniref:Uncharacterized protein n=1 Tax=Phytophthora cactorum TaxID=29920 RepID=A0A8T1AXK8_9STRA|nr:hypothetical protein PC115_g19245 [Phytophthora cactorum]KAG3210460.1 hypothetical protein PC129_g18544 [Phytophthora cactorum]
MEAVVEIDEDDNAEPPPKKIPVPAKLYDISGAYNPHCGVAIAEGLTKRFSQWGLNPVFCLRLVRDGASNDVLAALIKRRQKPRREANTEVTSASQPESRNPLLSKAPGETASVGVVNVACETAPADNGTYTEAEPWEQDRAVQELADFLREWQVMEQLKQQIDNTTSRNVS